MSAWKLEDVYPFRPESFFIDGLKLSYVDEGPRDSKHAVLLLHGNPTWSFYYRDLITALRPHTRVIAPDHMGCGLSDHPSNRHFRALDRVTHLEKLIRSLGLESFSLVVHDWGGPIGASLAVRNAGMVQRLVFLNTTLTETDSLPGMIRAAASALTGPLITKYSMRFLKLMTGYGVGRKLSDSICRGYYHPYRTIASRTAIWDFVQDIPFDPSHPTHADLVELGAKLPSLHDKPTLIYWGLKDPCFHRGMLAQVSRHFPQARVVELPNASHLVLEDMGPAAKADVVAFLTQEQLARREEESPARSLYGRFLDAAEQSPASDAVLLPSVRERAGHEPSVLYQRLSFSELRGRIFQYERGLQELGLRPGDKVLMLVPPGPDFLALAYGVMGRGAIPVFVDPGMGLDNLGRCIADAAPDVMIGAPRAQALKLLKRKSFRSIRFQVVAADIPVPGIPTLSFFKRFAPQPLPRVEVQGNDTVLIAFTSGATGTPKGVIYTAVMLEEQLRIFTEVFGVKHGTLDVPLLPIFSLFSLGCGVGSVFAPLDPSRPLSLKPDLLLTILKDTKAASSFGSPALWEKIADYALRYGVVLREIKKVFMAGAPVPLSLLQKMKQVTPGAEVSTPYGATEALPVTYVTGDELLNLALVPALGGEQGTPVGRPVPGVELIVCRPKIAQPQTKSDFEIAGAGSIGEILVCGANVSPSYLARPDANRSAKMSDSDGKFWHRIGDVGYLAADGMLYYCGRLSHVVAANGKRYYSDPVERIMNAHPKVKRSALVQPGEGKVGIVIEPAGPQAETVLTAELSAYAGQHPATSGISLFFYRGDFPVDPRHNAKIFRDRLGEWAAKELVSRQD